MINALALPLAFLLKNPDGSDMTPMDLFIAGGPIMWPIILISFLGLTVVVERLIFIIRENASRDDDMVEKILDKVENRDIEGAIELGKKSNDFVARIITHALAHKEHGLGAAFVRAANQEMNRFNQGLATLDTVITAAPLLGLLGTVTGMMRTFGNMSGDISSAAGQITGGVAEALVATACGLTIAITGLLPFNYLNTRIEEARHDVEDASHSLEVIIKKSESVSS